MTIRDLENHMVVDSPDAPWNAEDVPDNECDECRQQNGPTAEVKLNGITRNLCQHCDNEQATKRNYAEWTKALTAARPGEIVAMLGKDKYRTVLTVRENRMPNTIHGDSILFGPDGHIIGVSINTASCGPKYHFADLEDLQVIAW